MIKAENLGVKANGKDIINGLTFAPKENRIHVIMGPNGSGKSTLSRALAGHPNYEVTTGSVEMNGTEIKGLSPTEIAEKGLMLGFQHPPKVEGVGIKPFLRKILEARGRYSQEEIDEAIRKNGESVGLTEEQLNRNINEGFSGGERKRLEVLQGLLLNPEILILDEPDSGVDVDSLKVIAKGIEDLDENGTTVVIITHYGNLLNYLDEDKITVHLFQNGEIVTRGESSLVREVEEKGFNQVFRECGCD
ncbi:MAG: Fe-S cluster assembly ATPase SufC [Candidatus Acetothermia bacterium]